MKKFSFKKMVAYIITFTVLVQLLPLFPMGSAQAATPDTRVVDPSTMTDWQNYFGEKVLSTENAGGVWGDKSVFKTVEEFNAATEDGVGDYAFTMQSEENNFLVALSAIASEQTIEGYSSLPTDTVFVLDVSGSMSDNAMADMIEAANASIRRLLALNPANNRVGVIVYSGNRVAGKGVYGLNESATVLLPIGSYEGVGTKGNEIFLTYEDDAVSVAKGILPAGQTLPAKTSVGSTYMQAGMQLAVDLFNGVKDDVAVASGPQDGTVRIPVTVLMSDGAPSAATTAFQNIGNSTHGDGNASSSTTSFLTQLTCAWAKEEMEAIYHRSPLFYTIGFNTGGSANARAVLDPLNAEAPFGFYWSRYTSAMKNGNQTLEYSQDVTVPVVKGLERNYVDRYFPVSTDAELVQAFGKVVDQISIQSQYYPTLVEEGQHHLDGYITFNDELGLFMEVKDIKGLTVHGELYPGSAIVREIKKGTFGDIYAGNLSNLNNQGVAFLAAVEKRLGCSQAQAGAIVSQALRAGQLSYTDESNFSNFIGWYADEDGHFLGFWNGTDHSARPSNAVYANKSYGFMGKVGDDQSFESADMLHISVQVRTHIDLQHQTVIYKIPATLIPTVNYTIDFDGEHLEAGTNFRLGVKGAKEALRLLFEVGLRSDINPINVSKKIRQYEDETGESYPYQQNGSYYFYSNSWHEHSHKNQQIVDTHDATWLDFEPSYDNGRYYYAAHSPVYVKTAENTYQVTSVDPRNTGDTYYTRFTIFTTRDIGLSEAEMEHHYVPIDAQNIQLAQQDTDGTWYIPKGTVHRLLADSEGNDYHVVKVGEDPETAEKTHPSQTLDYSNHPSLVFMEDGVHCTACLGNNGRLTITPAQGIALSNTMEVSGLGEDIPFTFTVTLIPQEGGTLAESYPVYDAEGRFMEILPVDSQGTITYTLTPGQTVYIVDLPTGTGYTVEEVPAQGWKLLSSENASGIVQPYAYNNVIFLNGPDTVGNLILHKEINLGDAVGDTTYEKAFESEVYLEHDQPITQVAVNGQPTVVENGKLQTNILLKAGQTVVISGIPDGADYRVVEVNLPAGWKADQEAYTGKVYDTKNAVVTMINTYKPQRISQLNIKHTGLKNMIGREWLPTDSFEFRFEYFNGASWIAYSQTQKVSGNAQTKEFSFDNLLQNFAVDDTLYAYSFDKVGIYQFRIVESYTEIGGVNYDYSPKRFAVEIGNNFETGSLEVVNVTTVTPTPEATIENPIPAGTVITKNGDTYEVKTVFNNTYHVSGTALLTLDVQMNLQNQTDTQLGLDGFQFALYQLDEQGNRINLEYIGATDQEGSIVYNKAIDASLVGQTLTYYLVQAQGTMPGMVYDVEPVAFTVTMMDRLDGSTVAKVNGTESSTFEASFTNVYGEQLPSVTPPVTTPQTPSVEQPPKQPNGETPSTEDVPKTEDTSPIDLFAVLFVISGGMLTVLSTLGKKLKKQR